MRGDPGSPVVVDRAPGDVEALQHPDSVSGGQVSNLVQCLAENRVGGILLTEKTYLM